MKEDDDLAHSEISLKAIENHKKKQKRKNKKKKPVNNSKSSEDNLEDEVEKSVREVNKILGEAGSSGFSGSGNENLQPSSINRSLLQIEHKNLNPENEMKRMFGSKVSKFTCFS